MKRTAVVALATALLCAFPLGAEDPAAADPQTAPAVCDGAWRVERLPESISRLVPEGLFSVTVTGDGQLWAIGDFTRRGVEHSLLLHRSADGRWNVEAVPGEPGARLQRVVARLGDVWVLTGPGGRQKLLHRGASGPWRLVAVPKELTFTTDITVGRPGDVWLVQNTGASMVYHLVAGTWEHGDLPLGRFSLTNTYGLDSTGPDDVWVSGSAIGAGTASLVTWHWDGRTWRLEPVEGVSYDSARILAQRGGVAYMALSVSHTVQAHRSGTWRQLGQPTPPSAYVTGVELLGSGSSPVIVGALEDTFYAAYIGRLSPSGAWVPQPVLDSSNEPEAISGRFEEADGDGRGGVWAVGWLVGGGPLVAHAC